MVTKLQKVKLSLGIGYLVLVTTDLDSKFSHYAKNWQDALEWVACYSPTDLVGVFKIAGFKPAKLIAERSYY